MDAFLSLTLIPPVSDYKLNKFILLSNLYRKYLLGMCPYNDTACEALTVATMLQIYVNL